MTNIYSSLAAPIEANSCPSLHIENQEAAQADYNQVWICIRTHLRRFRRIDCAT